VKQLHYALSHDCWLPGSVSIISSTMVHVVTAISVDVQVQNEQDLVLSARQGNIAKVKQLIDSGVSVNAVDEFGTTPLMLLAAQGLDSGVQLLLDHPACLVNKRTSTMMVS